MSGTIPNATYSFNSNYGVGIGQETGVTSWEKQAGVSVVSFNGKSVKAYTEGGITYYNDHGTIYKGGFNSDPVDKKNYKYIPDVIGGTRKAVTQTNTVKEFRRIEQESNKDEDTIKKNDHKVIDQGTVEFSLRNANGSTKLEISRGFKQGDIQYNVVGKNIYKNGRLVSKDNYEYVPSEVKNSIKQEATTANTNVSGLTSRQEQAGVNVLTLNGKSVKVYTEGNITYYNDAGAIYKGGFSDKYRVDRWNYQYIPDVIGGTRKTAVLVTGSDIAETRMTQQEQYMIEHREETILDNFLKLKIERKNEGNPLSKEEEDVYKCLCFAFAKEGYDLTAYRVDVLFKKIEIPKNVGAKTIDLKESVKITLDDLKSIGVPPERIGDLCDSVTRSVNDMRTMGWKDYFELSRRVDEKEFEFVTKSRYLNELNLSVEQKVQLVEIMAANHNLTSEDCAKIGMDNADAAVASAIYFQYKACRDNADPEQILYDDASQQFEKLAGFAMQLTSEPQSPAKTATKDKTETNTKSTTGAIKSKKVPTENSLDELEFDKSKIIEKNKTSNETVDENGQVKTNYSNTINPSASQSVGKTTKYIPETGQWKPVGKIKSEWLKENNLKERWGEDRTKQQQMKFQGKSFSMELVDENGNVVGRVDKNYRVNGKVVPEHVHLNSDSDNVHYWFND